MIAQKIAYNVLISGLAKVLSIALALFAIGLLTRYLGPEGFGKYTIALAYFGFLMALGDLGLHSIATREISRKDANEEEIISKIFTLRVLVSTVIFALLSIFVWFLPYGREVQTAIFIIGGAFIFSSSYSLLNGIFQKNIAMDRVALAEIIGKVLQMGIIVFLVKNDLGFLMSIIAILAAMISNFILIYIFARRYVTITFSYDPRYWKSFLKESFPMGISAMATFLYFKVDTILLSTLQGNDDVGIYGAAYKIIETLIFFPAMITGLVFPLFARYVFTNTKRFIATANTTLKLFTIILIPLIISVQFLSTEIVNLVGGAQFSASAPILQILIFALAGIFFGHLFMNIAIAANLQKKLMFLLIVAALFNIVINIIVIPVYSYTGAAFVSVTTEIVVAFGALWLITKNTPYRIALPHAVGLTVAGSVTIVLYIILTFPPFITALCALVVYTVLILLFQVVTRSELAQIKPSPKAVNVN